MMAETLDCQVTYDVDASTKAALRFELRKRLCRFHFFVDFRRVIDIDPSVMGRGGQKLALWAHSQSPMLAGSLA